MKRLLQKRYLVAMVISLITSLSLFSLYLWGVKDFMNVETTFLVPTSNWAAFIFLLKPLLLLFPLVAVVMFCGTYFITRHWGSEIVITTSVGETNGSFSKKTKIKFMSDNERDLFKLIVDTKGDVYQKDLTQKSGLEKYQVSRILQRFEGYGLIQKERYGMTNQIFINNLDFDLD